MKTQGKLVAVGTLTAVTAFIAYVIGQYQERSRAMGSAQVAIETRQIAFNDEAYNAYRAGPPEVAVWAMLHVLRDYQDRVDRGADGFFFTKQGNTVDLMLTHARLARLYRSLNRPDQADDHLSQALTIGATLQSNAFTEAALMSMVDRLDLNHGHTETPTSVSTVREPADGSRR